MLRKDRSSFGGGVMLYISNNIKFNRLLEIELDLFEVMWVTLRPVRLPRPFTMLIVAVVYCPPSYNAERKRELADHILNSVDLLTRKYPDSGVFILGDFNTLDTSLFNRSLRLVQLISKATRGNNILDKVFTNCQNFYSKPCVFSPVGKSDHNCILIRPNCVNHGVNNAKLVYSRSLSSDAYFEISRELSRVKWQDMYRMDDCQLQMDFFYNSLFEILDKCAPIEECVSKDNDRPWVNSYFKKLIVERDLAFRDNNLVLYRKLRNKVNRVRKSLQKQFFLDHIEHLKCDNPANWWKNIKKICRLNSKVHDTFSNITFDGHVVDKEVLPEVINNFFTSVTSHITPLDSDRLNIIRQSLEIVPDEFIVSELDVYNVLDRLRPNKSPGPDLLPNRILQRLAFSLSAPMCSIINSSIRQGSVPDSWKLSRITPLPKRFPAATVENDIRPISVTNSISKLQRLLLVDGSMNILSPFWMKISLGAQLDGPLLTL